MKKFFCSFILPVLCAHAATYYADSRGGDDTNDGLAVDRAWQSMARINTVTFVAGDRLLLRAESVWEGMTFHPHGSGTPSAPIVIDRYGDGNLPVLRGQGRVPCVFLLEDQEGWDVANLEVTNHADTGDRSLRGVEIRAKDSGLRHRLHFRDLFIHEVNGVSTYTNDGDNAAKSFGGFVTLIVGDGTPTAWDDLVVENCRFADDGPAGLTMFSSWTAGHRAENSATWCPSRGVIIRGCTFERIARNGLVVRACQAPLIEHNLFSHCGLAGSGNASFAFHCDDALFQFNEACYTKYNPGDADAAGFDSDYNCRRTVFQFNYSHDNDYGFILLCCNGKVGFNEGTVVRYNISQNDGGVSIRFAGPVKGARIYSNTIYINADMKDPHENVSPRIVAHKSWDGWSDDCEFSDNIVVNLSERSSYDFGKSTHNRYVHNLFFGAHPSTEPPDARKLNFDPLFFNSGGASSENPTAEAGVKSAFTAYHLKPGSPAVGLGATAPGDQ